MKYIFPIISIAALLSNCTNPTRKETSNPKFPVLTQDFTVDTSLISFPCDLKELSTYDGNIMYRVQDLDTSAVKVNRVLSNFENELNNRNENINGNEHRKEFTFRVKSDDFLVIEKSLDSILGKPVTKQVSIYKKDAKDLAREFEASVRTYRSRIMYYRSVPDKQERAELERGVVDAIRMVEYSRKNLESFCKNYSNYRITILTPLDSTDEHYQKPQARYGYVY
jgi:hypothetical protein